jgi:hypothetical protein
MHNHDMCGKVCEHNTIRFCKHCQIPHCLTCGKEWGFKVSYWQGQYAPTYSYTAKTGGLVTGNNVNVGTLGTAIPNPAPDMCKHGSE